MPPRLPDRLRHWLNAPVDIPVVCEIAADYVAAARCQGGSIVEAAVAELPANAVRPAPVGDNVVDAASVQRVLESVVGQVADGARRCALLVPDLLARVALLELEELPARRDEADQLLRWRLRKDLPFDVSQAALSYDLQATHNSKPEVVVVTCLKNLVHQYEDCVERLGLQPGWVTLSTLALLGCVRSSSTEARLLAKRDHTSLSLAILHDSAIRVFRTLPLPPKGSTVSGTNLFEKVYQALVYFQDQWSQPVREVLVAGMNREERAAVAAAESDWGCPVREIDTKKLPASAIKTDKASDYRLLPLMGWVVGSSQ